MTKVSLSLILMGTLAVSTGAAQRRGNPVVSSGSIEIPDHGRMVYTIATPRGDPGGTRPLVLALHPGGGMRGGPFMLKIVEPALRDLDAVLVAPDAPTRSWSSEISEHGVLLLLEEVLQNYDIDRGRILVTGFSMGGFGTWFFVTNHPDQFTGAIPIAASPRDGRLDQLGTIPVHLIHSRDDSVIPIGPALAAAEELKQQNHPVRFTELSGVGHFQMGGYVEALREAGEWMKAQWERNR